MFDGVDLVFVGEWLIKDWKGVIQWTLANILPGLFLLFSEFFFVYLFLISGILIYSV